MLHSYRSGFSLVELSIVLVILGLLTGGILGGRSLIHAAELRSVVQEYEQYQTATVSFREQYDAMPGDMLEATRYWGRADNGSFSGQCAAPDTDEGTGKQTCNGNGNGDLDTNNELFRFWQHLANAGLIAGNYSGVGGVNGSNHHVIGENCPASRMSSTIGWGARQIMLNFTGTGTLWETYPPRDLLRLGGETGSILSGNVFTPEDAWNIDMKTDDGRPGSGSIWSRTWDTCTTATGNTEYKTAEYALSNTDEVCALFLFFD